MSNRVEDLLPEVATKCRSLLDAAAAAGISVVVVQTLRTVEEQDRIYAKGRTIPGEPCTHRGVERPVGTCPVHPLGVTVSKAKGGYSWHNFGRAFDLALVNPKTGKAYWPLAKDKRWQQLGELGLVAGLDWGGSWTVPDTGHFQDRGGQTLAAAREAARQAGGTAPPVA